MTQGELQTFISQLPNVEQEENMGYLFFFVGDNHMVPFATIGYKDNDGDSVSNLNRDGVFRLNMGISKESYDALFANSNFDTEIDYTQLDVFMPHPHYAQMLYVCILNPNQKNEEQVKKLLLEAHVIAAKREEARKK